MEKSENNLVAWIAERFGRPDDADIPIGIGDDMAMVRAGSGEVLIAADMLMDGVHFDSAVHEPERIGRKALAVNLSDCAAMAVRPRYALVSVALPNGWSMEQAQRLFLGMEKLAKQFDVRIIGGDTNSWDRPLVIDVSVVAEPWPGVKPVKRTGLQPNDLLGVTGWLGGSVAGHHLDFEPRVSQAKWLAEAFGNKLHAMMDLSDGLSIDARRMCDASNMGIELFAEILDFTASPASRDAALTDGRSVLDHVLNDGEDFELLYAVDVLSYTELKRQEKKNPLNARNANPPHRMVGCAIEEPGLWLKRQDGSRETIKPKGWQHFQ
ncbi:MAG TPA: thiamine-phosphate kinase [Phycisphaerae bacterium]|nr:thiamine-phosphate kinase [Phycisphaerae bacterium]